MILGHYAPALIPYSRFERKYPVTLFLVCANIPEFIWLLLAFLGIEVTTPASFLDATLSGLQVKMIYSHNLIPGFFQAIITAIIVEFIYSDRALSFWCGGLVMLHIACDAVVGYDHQIMGESSPVFTLNSYRNFPHTAVLIEFVFSFLCIYYFDRLERKAGREITSKQRRILFAFFGIGILVWLPAATTSINEILGFLKRAY
ncbi:MAG: hypothetical protein K8R21_09585 [Leptospira sp.]|nr:hypothetical protein [Leptospira sp.]